MIPRSPRLANARDFNDLPTWLYFWMPLGYWLLVYLCGLLLDWPVYDLLISGEITIVEISTVLILIAAIVSGIRALWLARSLGIKFLYGWLLIGVLGCIYFAGEEASWGQTYLRWQTPESWEAINEQQETNLHNLAVIGGLTDQGPRLLLTLGALVGGIVMPLYLRARKQSLDPAAIWYWIWPTAVCLPSAVLGVFLARIDRSISDQVGYHWPYYNLETGELKELMLAIFLLVYLASLAMRLRQLSNSAQA